MKQTWKFYLVLFCLLAAGCIRLAGTGGFWYQDNEGEIKSKQATLDTANLTR